MWQAWVRLAKLPEPEAPAAERLAFARKPLLGKTLAMVDQMELRPLANVLWAIGKLRLDLTREEPLGPHLAAELQAQIRLLLSGGALEVGMDAAQLWSGMFFCKYPWPRELLGELLARSLPCLETWDDVAVTEVRVIAVAVYYGEKCQGLALLKPTPIPACSRVVLAVFSPR